MNLDSIVFWGVVMNDEVLIHFRLVGEEARALRAWAASEFRDPRAQMRYILRAGLQEQGLLTDGATDSPPEESEAPGEGEKPRIRF